MQISASIESPTEAAHDLLVLGVFSDDLKSACKSLDTALGGALTATLREQDFTGKAKQQVVFATWGRIAAKRVALFGLGDRAEVRAELILRCAGQAVRLANAHGAESLLLALPAKFGQPLPIAELVGRGLVLGQYRFDTYKSDKGRAHSLKKAALHIRDKAVQKAVQDDLGRGEAIAWGVSLARDLVNAPAMDVYPESFAQRAATLAKAAGLKCQIFDPDALAKKKMNLLLAVGMGSVRGPRLVHISYMPKQRGAQEKPPAVLVGKGITFDSGGLSLKPADAMYGMKVDMHGAATALSAVLTAAKLQLPHPVHAVMALAENMPSGQAIRPGDVVSGAAGKTVEINNTDAEGRLVLADALHFAAGLNPACMIDLATLTGACMVALGHHTAGLFGNDDALCNALLAAAQQQGEDLWRMPLTPVLKEQLKSDIADMRNTGERYGGAITAALFLKEFVGEHRWAHLDIAGPATSAEDAGIMTKGGTGIGVACLVQFLRDWGGPDRG